MPGLQEWIHAMEEGRGSKIIKITSAVLGFVAIAMIYNFLCYKNFFAPEAMDAAQVGRNLSEGKGFTTDVIRPASIYLVQEKQTDPLLKSDHPDLANAPAFPALLAALFKVAPIKHLIPTTGTFRTHQPERWIAALNQILFFCAVVMVFFLARRLLNDSVAWISALILAGTELFWQFSVSGLSTLFLMVIFLGIVMCLVRMDEWQREEKPNARKIMGFAVLTGVLLGLAGLTRYSFLWLIFPTLLFGALFIPRFRIQVPVVIVISFLVVISPWIARNISLSGAPFGLATYAALEQTPNFPENTLERSLNPAFDKVTFKNLANKLLTNSRQILRDEVPRLGGSWAAAFFLVGLLLMFRNPTVSRLRIFLVATLALFIIVQALGRTHLSDVSKEVHSENLLVVFAPLVFIFGAGFFYVLVEQLKLSNVAARKAIAAAFVILLSAPLLFTLLPPRTSPFAYPPYHPPLIQETTSWMKESELMMSDVPWAIAWYGNRQCALLPLDTDKDFFAINDDMKRVQAVYLSPNVTDGRLISEIMKPKTWEQLSFSAGLRGADGLGNFPLRSIRRELGPSHLFLADWERWRMPRK